MPLAGDATASEGTVEAFGALGRLAKAASVEWPSSLGECEPMPLNH
jgi:hypothetical protein